MKYILNCYVYILSLKEYIKNVFSVYTLLHLLNFVPNGKKKSKIIPAYA